MKQKVITFIRGVKKRAIAVTLTMLCACMQVIYAQDSGAGIKAITKVTQDITKYIPAVQQLLYAIAAIVGLGGVVTIFIKMNNEENDIKKTIMLVVGSCVMLIAMATAMPMFFGL